MGPVIEVLFESVGTVTFVLVPHVPAGGLNEVRLQLSRITSVTPGDEVGMV